MAAYAYAVQALLYRSCDSPTAPGGLAVHKVLICSQLIALAVFKAINQWFRWCKGAAATAMQKQQQKCCSAAVHDQETAPDQEAAVNQLWDVLLLHIFYN